ncbi:MAG: diguanylate cyclase [Lachnospiraceae bacterium]|nr:diguanylate cyclase [Lachnospiraceae bacterium]
MAEYSILYTEINFFSFLLMAIVLSKNMGLSKMVAQRNFSMAIASEMLFVLSDTVFVLINEGTVSLGAYTPAARIVCRTVYYFATVLMCYYWFMYFEYMSDSIFVKTKLLGKVSSVFVWILSVLLVLNLFIGFLFYVDGNGAYHRGSYFILTYILAYVYVVLAFIHALVRLIRSRDENEKKTLKVILLFPIAPGGAGILQFIYPRFPIACAVLAITTALLYLNWIDQLISLDPLTGLNNRKQMKHFYQSWVRNRSDETTMYLMMIDANKFKAINDTYGHVEGDRALKNIADALRLGCRDLAKRTTISRYGGDEFSVMFETSSREECEKLKAGIKEKLALINKETEVPFDLTVSIGIASTSGNLTLKQLIGDADEDMYEEKKNAGGR